MTLTSSSAIQSVLIVPSPPLLSQLKCVAIPVTVVLFDWQHAQEEKKAAPLVFAVSRKALIVPPSC